MSRKTNKHEKVRKKSVFGSILKGFFAVLFTILAAVLIFAGVAIYIVERGPSPELRDIFVLSVQQSSAAKPLAKLFLSEEQVEGIMEANRARDDDLNTDTELINIEPPAEKDDQDDIIVEDVIGPTYRGKMMIVKDPSRVYVYCIPNYNAKQGMKVSEMVKTAKAVAGINGGGFSDAGGMGTGNVPLGIVMSKGVWRNGNKNAKYKLIGRGLGAGPYSQRQGCKRWNRRRPQSEKRHRPAC